MWILPDGTIVRSDSESVVVNGERYGKTDWFNASKLAEIGAKPFREEGLPESPYYVQSGHTDALVGGTVVRTYAAAPAVTVEELRVSRGFDVNVTAGQLIRDSGHDRYAARKASTGREIPQDIYDYAEAVRARCNAIEAELAAIEDYDALAAYVVDGWPQGVL